MIRRPPRSTRSDTLFPYTTLVRSSGQVAGATGAVAEQSQQRRVIGVLRQRGFTDGTGLGEVPALMKIKGAVERGRVFRQGRSSAGILPLAGFLPPHSLTACRCARPRSEERRVGKECGSKCRSRWAP